MHSLEEQPPFEAYSPASSSPPFFYSPSSPCPTSPCSPCLFSPPPPCFSSKPLSLFPLELLATSLSLGSSDQGGDLKKRFSGTNSSSAPQDLSAGCFQGFLISVSAHLSSCFPLSQDFFQLYFHFSSSCCHLLQSSNSSFSSVCPCSPFPPCY